MKVIILAAGRGTRLRPLTDSVPKALIKVMGKPILQWQIEAYLFSGINSSEIFVVSGYKHEQIEFFLKHNFDGVNMIINEFYKTTNNMYSLYLALKTVWSRGDDDVIISNGDCIYEFEIVKEFVNFKKSNSIACDKGKYNTENMKVAVKDGKIYGISKNIPQEQAYGLSIDLYKISGKNKREFMKILESILEDSKQLWAEEALNAFAKNHDIYPFDINGKLWFEIDTIEDLKMAENLKHAFPSV